MEQRGTERFYQERQRQEAKEVNGLEGVFVLLLVLIGIVVTILGVSKRLGASGSSAQKPTPAARRPTSAPRVEDYRDIQALLDYLKEKLWIPLPEFRVQNFEYFFPIVHISVKNRS